MSSIQNDLAGWAAKARMRGHSTIEIDVDLAEEASRQIVEKSNRIADLEWAETIHRPSVWSQVGLALVTLLVFAAIVVCWGMM